MTIVRIVRTLVYMYQWWTKTVFVCIVKHDDVLIRAINGPRQAPPTAIVAIHVYVTAGDLPNCVTPGSGNRLNQAIITSYRFNCCGVVIEWRALVERSTLMISPTTSPS